jgi:hypothetical protein
MDPLTGLALAACISLLIGGCVYFAIRKPLNSLLANSCPGNSTTAFWERFTQIMLFLSPLFIAVSFGTPPADLSYSMDSSAILTRIITCSLIGVFIAMVIMGYWISSIARSQPHPETPKVSPEDRWGIK